MIQQASGMRPHKGDLLKEEAERNRSFRSPNRRFWDFWGQRQPRMLEEYQCSVKHTFPWLQTLLSKLKDVGTSRSLISGASWTWHRETWDKWSACLHRRAVLWTQQRPNHSGQNNALDRGECLNSSIIVNVRGRGTQHARLKKKKNRRLAHWLSREYGKDWE